MRIDYTAYCETLNGFRRLSNLADGTKFYDSFNELYYLAQAGDIDFVEEKLNCIKLFKKFITDANKTAKKKDYAYAIKNFSEDMTIWFNSALKNLQEVFDDKLSTFDDSIEK